MKTTLFEFHYENVKAFQEDLIINHEYDEIRKVAQAVRKAFEDHGRHVVVDNNVWVIQFEGGMVGVYEIDRLRCVRYIVKEVA